MLVEGCFLESPAVHHVEIRELIQYANNILAFFDAQVPCNSDGNLSVTPMPVIYGWRFEQSCQDCFASKKAVRRFEWRCCDTFSVIEAFRRLCHVWIMLSHCDWRWCLCIDGLVLWWLNSVYWNVEYFEEREKGDPLSLLCQSSHSMHRNYLTAWFLRDLVSLIRTHHCGRRRVLGGDNHWMFATATAWIKTHLILYLSLCLEEAIPYVFGRYDPASLPGQMLLQILKCIRLEEMQRLYWRCADFWQ